MAGPMKRATLKMIELIATAEVRSSFFTKLGIRDCRAGWLNPPTAPWNSASANSSSIVIMSKKTNPNSRSDWTTDSDWQTTTTFSRSMRSASTPPNGPSTTTGKRSAKATAATQKADSVSVHDSHPTASR